MEFGEVTGGSVLPENHEDQLQLGFRLITNAYTNRMASLEQEVKGLRLTCEEQKNQAAGLQRKNSALENELVEGHQRAQQLADENKELFKTVQGLRRQLCRLEGLRKSVLDSLNDHQLQEVENEDNRLYLRDDYLKGAMPLTLAAVHGEPPPQTGPVYSRPTSPPPGEVAQAPYRTPSPASMPTASSTPAAAAPFGADAGQQVDGKQFFRKARQSLSYGAFNEFLASIKKLNNNQQTREETLAEAQHIFGPEQQNLYVEFEQLLNRHAPF
mmetsp:Transcript_83042/g.220320  ORF Transcript_83042/g.220320 Transcript_83042/m.220320 type:complete len:270 (-) Transcript_83042:140-949(-)